MNRFIAFLILCFFLTKGAIAQYSLCGSVFYDKQKAAHSTIFILETGQNVDANKDGNFCFADLPPQEYTIMAEYEGFVSPMIKVLISEDYSGLELRIEARKLEELTVEGASKAEQQAVHSIKTEIINLARVARSSVSVEQLMNRSAGIRIRNAGGLGAEADVVVGGFNGKSIKFLMDGIPIDYLGTSMGITKIPTNAADFIEVYKGVMPTEVGVDALGGAINIISKKPTKTTHNVSYEIGSFGTHRVNLNSFIRLSPNFSYGVNVFGNRTKNNFFVDHLPVVDTQTGRTNFISARLFNNAYSQGSGEAFVNFENRKWADLFKVKVNAYSLKRGVQNDFVSRSRAFGEAYKREFANFVPSVEHKINWSDNKLKMEQFAVFSRINNLLADTLKNGRYDWLSNRYETVSGSEMGLDYSNLTKPIMETQTDNFTYRGLVSYKINQTQKVLLNVVGNYYMRESDDLNTYQTKTHIDYGRLIAGAGYQYQLFNYQLEGLSQVKYLGSRTEGDLLNVVTGEREKAIQNGGVSLSQSLKYHSYNGWLVRASAENTYRLPDQMEIFGDNSFIIPNIGLKPERSLNFNFGVNYKRKDKYNVEVNTYFRDVNDLIKIKEISQFQSQFLNLDKVKGYGVELEGTYRPVNSLILSGNLTYNEFRFKGANDTRPNNDHFINARVSNMPFYFGNATATYSPDKLFSAKGKFQVYWTYSYVHQFYLDFIEKQFEPSGFLGLFGKSKVYTDRVIPIQQIHSAGIVWTNRRKGDKPYSFSTEINNIFDKPIYNTFKMQSAGRSISAKVTYDF